MILNDHKENLAAKTVALVMKKFRKEFPGRAEEWADEEHRRAMVLLYQPVYDDGITNVEALAEFVMVEIRLVHQSGIAKTTARQADMRRRAAWRTLEASGSTSTTTQEHADDCIENRWSMFMEAYLVAHPNADWEDVERDRLSGSLFDPDDPYLVDLAARVLAGEGEDYYEAAA